MIPMVDLRKQYLTCSNEIDTAIKNVLESGSFILGENVRKFEKEFSLYCGSKYGVGVASGTEALQISLLALGIGVGDEVITVSNTAVPTALAISLTGAKPVFTDVNSADFTMDCEDLYKKISKKTKAIIPVHLYGHPSDIEEICEIGDARDIPIVEDACQAHGASYNGKKVGTFGQLGCFSFYPTKNLGTYGDGGLVLTDESDTYDKLLMLRNIGQKTRYNHRILGLNSRLDEIQAAILREKLKFLDQWNEKRRDLAQLYSKLLSERQVIVPTRKKYATHVYHLYVIKAPKRNALKKYLLKNGIMSDIHYPTPIHLQAAFSYLNLFKGSLPRSEALSGEILSIPLFPELTTEELNEIVKKILEFYNE